MEDQDIREKRRFASPLTGRGSPRRAFLVTVLLGIERHARFGGPPQPGGLRTADKDVEPDVTDEPLALEFENELERRMQILRTDEAGDPAHRRVTLKQFAAFVGVTIAICLIGAGVAAL